MHGLVHDPALLSGRLQDEYVVDVVVRIEAAIGGRRDVGVRLHRMTQIVDRLPDEVDQRRPQPVQALQHNRCASGELGQHLGGVHLVGHLRAESGRPEVAVLGQHVALLGQPDERRAHPALGDQLVDRVGREQIAEVAGQRAGRLSSGLRPQYSAANVWGSVAMQRLSIE